MIFDVSIVIPSYNERENIIPLLNRLLEACSDLGVECIVVDDDSPDRTWELAQTKFEDNPRVRVIRRIENRGLGSAVVRGIKEARGSYVGVIDGDLQHPPRTRS
ncbi:glycosyltransferase [Halogeometricum sp. CBA1124]|uniref:glycosyltransferase n=1 Tax=Halogeometricum sp. CBA1124 TaxID=2668071 RepID=UPI00142B398B|nr:glycosyltransferase [Halogeometricum sp. CBA1124]